jgi:large subunit ribosomal protein L22
MAEVAVHLRYARIAPRKARAVARLIQGRQTSWAASQLNFLPQRAARSIGKLLHSGIAVAKAEKLSEETLTIKKALVQEGPRLKRARPHFRGIVRPIEKQMSHITLVLSDDQKSSLKKP